MLNLAPLKSAYHSKIKQLNNKKNEKKAILDVHAVDPIR